MMESHASWGSSFCRSSCVIPAPNAPVSVPIRLSRCVPLHWQRPPSPLDPGLLPALPVFLIPAAQDRMQDTDPSTTATFLAPLAQVFRLFFSFRLTSNTSSSKSRSHDKQRAPNVASQLLEMQEYVPKPH